MEYKLAVKRRGALNTTKMSTFGIVGATPVFGWAKLFFIFWIPLQVGFRIREDGFNPDTSLCIVDSSEQ